MENPLIDHRGGGQGRAAEYDRQEFTDHELCSHSGMGAAEHPDQGIHTDHHVFDDPGCGKPPVGEVQQADQ